MKIFYKYDIIYKPYKRSNHIKVNYLLDELENNENIPKELLEKFNKELRNQKR